MTYPSWPTNPTHETCLCPEYAAFRDWLDQFIESKQGERPYDMMDFRALADLDPAVLWVMVQEAGKHTTEGSKG